MTTAPPEVIESFVVKKAGKYMEGHSYCNIAHIGYKFRWSKTKDGARIFNDESLAKQMASISGGKVVNFNQPIQG